ncbi:MAG TPA: DUF3971 domain-containing protein [Gammaproteobacteria bacterium]
MKLLWHPLRYLWTATALLIILLAVAVSAARALLPHLDGYRATIEARVSAYLGQPVAIERFDARLVGLTPSIILRQVTLKSPAGDSLARVGELRIGLDLFASLRHLSPVLSELVVTGAQLAVVRRVDGGFTVEGLAIMASQGATPADPTALGSWLLAQGRLALHDSTLVWRDEQRARALRFEHVDFELLNTDQRHRLNASVALPEGGGKTLKVALDLHGNPLDGTAWGGAIYAKADALRPLFWLPLLTTETTSLPIKTGEISAELWSKWDEGAPVRSEGRFVLRDARLQTAGRPTATVKEFSGELLWQRRDEGWELDLQRLLLALGNEPRQTSRLHLTHGASADLLMADQLDLKALGAVALHVPLLSDTQLELLQALAPRGQLHQLRVERTAAGDFTSQGEFTALGTNARQTLPGFDGLSGSWRADNRGGEIVLNSAAVAFDAPHLFRAPLHIDTLLARFDIRRMEQGWYLQGREISATNKDVAARGELDMQFEPQHKPYLDLRLAFRDGVAKEVPHYVPAGIMGEGVVKWLDGAFIKGRASSGTVLFHGRTSDFPFEDQQGHFETRFKAEGVELNFADEWPHLGNLSGEVLFLNQGMAITPHSATLFSTSTQHASVAIADLKAPLLEVALSAAPPANDVLRLLRETPLASHMGEALTGMTAAGQSDLSLRLRLPLSKSMEEKVPLHYEGEITLHDAQLKVWDGVEFRKLNGQVSFNDNKFSAAWVLGELFDAPVTLDVATDESALTVVSARGGFSAGVLRRELRWPQLEHLDGVSEWRGLLYLPRGEGSHPSLEFHSSLVGMALDLPAPLGKSHEQAVPLAVRLAFGAEEAKRLSVRYGERLAARFAFTGKEMELERAALHFGSGGAELPAKAGWLVSGSLVAFDWEQWRPLLPERSGSGTPLPFTLQMERLGVLASARKSESGGSLNPANFPALDMHIRNFSYDDWHLGELTGTSRSDAHHWEMPDLRFAGPHHEIHMAVNWREGQRSHLEMNATSDNLEQMLHTLGLASMITRGKGTLKGQLEWPGVLSDFSWASAGGAFSVELTDGALVEVNPGAGRILGLLSLQALPRRLSLDFRDLFNKGMQFDEIKGDVQIRGGDAYTSNLYIKSPSSGMLVEGRTGLVRRDYDLVISVIPNVSESVAITSALAWGPQVAAAVLLFQSLFKKDIAKATMIRYSVTGSWDDPQLNRLEQPKEKTPAQNK